MSGLLPSFQGFVKGATASVVGVSTVAAGLLWYGQNFLIYPAAFPAGSRENVPTPAEWGMPYEDLTLDTIDSVKIRGYLMLAPRTLHATTGSNDEYGGGLQYARRHPTMIMFHGNGGNMGHRIPLARQFLRLGCNVLMVSYRGYGLSEGSPSEKGFRIDSQTALDYLTSHPILGASDKGPASKVILYGQSIGGAVAIDLAARNPNVISGLIVENTFLSIPRLIPTAVPYLSSFTFLCHQKWESETTITKLPPDMALLMLSGARDEVVPSSHMKELWEIAQKSGRKKATWVDFPTGAHNDTCMKPGYWEAVRTFIEGLTTGDVVS